MQPIALVTHLVESRSQLVGTTCGFSATSDAFQRLLYLRGWLADAESADAFKVAVATAKEREVANDAVVVDIDGDKAAASAASYVF